MVYNVNNMLTNGYMSYIPDDIIVCVYIYIYVDYITYLAHLPCYHAFKPAKPQKISGLRWPRGREA